MANNDIMFDPILGELRTQDISGGTGGTAYEAGPGIDGVALEDGVIAVSGLTATVSGTTATITPKGSTVGVKVSAKGGVNLSGSTTGEVELDAKDLSDGTQSVSKDLKETRFIDHADNFISKLNNVTLLHFSDIHGDASALGRIMAQRTAFGDLVNDAICTGDIVQRVHEEIASWWNPSVLTCIGNHEAATYDTKWHWNVYGMAANAELFITPFVSNWGVTHTAGTTYYYKDYTTASSINAGVRLIVIDEVLYMSDSFATDAANQTSWLQSTLASALSAGLHVVIALHAPAVGAAPQRCSFTRLKQTSPYPDDGILYAPSEVVNAVASSISSGLHFVGYLCGHIHKDVVYDVTGDRSQMMYSVTTANVGTLPITNAYNQWAYYDDKFRDDTLDAYNLVSIDTYNTSIRIVRGGGANIDCFARPRETISVNYSTGVIIDREIARGVSKDAVDFRLESSKDKLSVARYISTEEITGSTVTLHAGHAYQGIVSDTLTLNVEALPQSSYGLEGLLDVTLSGGTVVSGANNVIIDDVLVDGNRNICSVRYIDGIVLVKVLTSTSPIPAGAYVVSIATGTVNGSLYYGLTVDSIDRVIFDSELDTIEVSFGGATVTDEKHLVGNGVENTILGGTINPGTQMTMENLSLADTYVSGGTLFIPDGVVIASGSTVTSVSGKHIVLSGGTVNGVLQLTDSSGQTSESFTLNGTVYYDLPNYILFGVSGTTVSGSGTMDGMGKVRISTEKSCTIDGITIQNFKSTGYAVGFYQYGAPVYACTLSNVTVTGCTGTGTGSSAGGIVGVGDGNTLTIQNSIISGNTANLCGGVITIGVNSTLNIIGSTISHNICLIQISGSPIHAIWLQEGTINLENSLIIDNGSTGTVTTEMADCVKLYSYGTSITQNILNITGCTFGVGQVVRCNAGTISLSGVNYTSSRFTCATGATTPQVIVFKSGSVLHVLNTNTYSANDIVFMKKIVIEDNVSLVIEGSTVALNGGTAGTFTAASGKAYSIRKETGEIVAPA